MFGGVRNDFRSVAEFIFRGNPRADFDSVFLRNKSHDSETVRPVIRQNLVDQITVFDERRLVHRLSSALVTAADHEQIGMLTEAFVPHLLRSVASLAVTLLPLHPPFGRIEIVLRLFWFRARPESHV